MMDRAVGMIRALGGLVIENMDGTSDIAERILRSYHTWAVVGISADPYRASYSVARFLQEQGFRIIPINPGLDEVLGERAFPDLRSIPDRVEGVDIFRRSELAGAHVDEAIEIGAKAVWMQIGVIDHDAAQRARAAGLDVVMNRCPKVEYRRLIGAG